MTPTPPPAHWLDRLSLRLPARLLLETTAPLHHLLAEWAAACAPLLPWDAAQTAAWAARLREEIEQP